MELSPYLLLRLVIAAFLFGLAVGVLNDVFRLSRILLGVRYSSGRFEALYTRPLPILKRPLRDRSKGRWTRVALPILLFFQDLLLFCFAGVGTVILNFYYNDGRFRFYTVFAVLIGFLLYYFTVGKLCMLLSEAIVYLLRAALTILFTLLFRPVAKFCMFFGRNVKKLNTKFEKTIAKRRKTVYNIYKVKKVMQEAEKGFLDDWKP